MNIANWKIWLGAKAASAATFIPSLYCAIMVDSFHIGDLLNNKPDGLNVVRDVVLLTLSGTSYIISNNLYEKSLKEVKASQLEKAVEPEDIEEIEPKTRKHSKTNPIDEETIDDLFEKEEPAVIKTEPTHLELYGEGRRALEKGDYASAEEYFKKAISGDADSARYHYNLALAQSEQGKYKPALESVRKARSLRPNSPKYFTLLGDIFTALAEESQEAGETSKSANYNKRAEKAYAYARQLNKE